MTIVTELNRKELISFFDLVFYGVALKEKGYCTYIPIGVSHITINGVNYFFDNEEYNWYLSYNKYGQMAVEYTTEKPLDKPSNRMTGQCPLNRITFNLKDLTSIEFHAPTRLAEINPKTDNYYYKLFVLTLR